MSYNIFQLEIILLKVIRLFSLGERRQAKAVWAVAVAASVASRSGIRGL